MADVAAPPGTSPDDDAYYLEPVTLDDDEDDEEYEYAEVEVEDGEEEAEPGEAEDEDLDMAIATMRHKEEGPPPKEELPPRAAVTRRPEVLDDFIRNVLLKLGMNETLDMFQREWCVLQRPRLQPALGLLRRGVERRDA